jgi:hypothetical protein
MTYNDDLGYKHFCATTRVIFHIGDNHASHMLNFLHRNVHEVDTYIVSWHCLLESLVVELDALDIGDNVVWRNVELAHLVQMQGFCNAGLDPSANDRAKASNFATLVQWHT